MRLKSQKGAAALEFAIVAPLLLLILFGIVEFSILLFDKAMLTNASREGARAGIVFVSDRSGTLTDIESNIDAVVRQYCENNLVSFGSGSPLTIVPTWLDGNDPGTGPYGSGDSLQLEVTYQFNFLVFSKLFSLFGGSFADGFNLNAVTVMRLE